MKPFGKLLLTLLSALIVQTALFAPLVAADFDCLDSSSSQPERAPPDPSAPLSRSAPLPAPIFLLSGGSPDRPDAASYDSFTVFGRSPAIDRPELGDASAYSPRPVYLTTLRLRI